MAGLAQRLSRHHLVALDTSVFIYQVEQHPAYGPLASLVLTGVQAGEYKGVTPGITLMELTVHPWRAGQKAVAQEYEALLVHFPNLYMIDVTRNITRWAAQLRARYGLRPADALQIATALDQRATAFVTNDVELQRVSPLLDVLVLRDFIKG